VTVPYHFALIGALAAAELRRSMSEMTHKRTLTICLLIGLAGCSASPRFRHTASTASEVVTTVRRYVPNVSSMRNASIESVAGHYSTGMLALHHLYLFPDGTYFYAHRYDPNHPKRVCWANFPDVPSSNVLHDRGAWSVSQGVILLRSDRSIPTWEKCPGDRRYTPLMATSQENREPLLMGMHEGYSTFLDYVRSVARRPWDQETYYHGGALVRWESISLSDASDLKAEIVRRCQIPIQPNQSLQTGGRRHDGPKVP